MPKKKENADKKFLCRLRPDQYLVLNKRREQTGTPLAFQIREAVDMYIQAKK